MDAMYFMSCLVFYFSLRPESALSEKAANISNVNNGNSSPVQSSSINIESNKTRWSVGFENKRGELTSLKSLTAMTLNQTVPAVTTNRPTDNMQNDVSATKKYDVLSWLPKRRKPKSTANLTILPILATLAFLIMLCLKGCTWFRESTKEKDRDSFEADRSFMILHEGDKDYDNVDFRSDLSTPYDTYSSYMSFLRRNNNYDTVNSIRSLPGSRNYDSVTSYRSLLQQRLENPNYDSVTSYQAFLQRVRAMNMKDVEIQVELLNEKPHERNGSIRHTRKQSRSENSSPKFRTNLFNHNGIPPVLDSLLETSICSGSAEKETHDVGVGNGVISREGSEGSVTKHHYEKSPTRNRRSNSPVKHRCHSSPVRRSDLIRETSCADSRTRLVIPRFKVSFVTDDDSDVKAQNTHSPSPEKDKLSPTSILPEKQDRSAEKDKLSPTSILPEKEDRSAEIHKLSATLVLPEKKDRSAEKDESSSTSGALEKQNLSAEHSHSGSKHDSDVA